MTTDEILTQAGIDIRMLTPQQKLQKMQEIARASIPQGQQVPAGGAPSGGNPVAELAQSREKTLNNIRSPFVRRDIGGGVIDENTPSGIDWLNQNNTDVNAGKHSWDRQVPIQTFTPEERALIESAPAAGQSPFAKRQGEGITAVTGQYGSGMAVTPGSPFQPGQVLRSGAEEGYQVGETLMPDESARLAQNIQAGTNASYSPFANMPVPSPDLDGVRMPPMEPIPVNPPIPQSPGQGLYNEYTPFAGAGPMPPDASPAPQYTSPRVMAQSPLYQAPTDEVGKAEDLTAYANEAIKHDQPGFVPWLGRFIGSEATGAYDEVMNALFRKGEDRGKPTQKKFADWVYGR